MPIVISVDKYCVTPPAIYLGTQGSVEIETLEFQFSKEWSGMTKCITFYAGHAGLRSPFILPENDVLSLPPQATALFGSHTAVISGCAADVTVIYSQDITCIVGYHAKAGSQPPPQYTPDEYQQFIAIVQGDRLEAQSAADRAENAVDAYPKIFGGTWWVFDVLLDEYVNTGVSATGECEPLTEATNEDIDNIFIDLKIQTRSI